MDARRTLFLRRRYHPCVPARAVPDLPALLNAIDVGATHRHSTIHGEGHWKCVAWTGLALLPELSGCDPAVLLLFGMLHDTQRLDDGHDPLHGPRAAVFARSLHGRGLIALEPARLHTLCHACELHTSGAVSDDPTVGACWDADRLNLWRVGMRPDPKWLSTAAAKKPDRILAANRFEGQHLRWTHIFERYVAAAGVDAATENSRKSG
jgi:uncharacterized protein